MSTSSSASLLGRFPDLPTSLFVLRAHAFVREIMPDFLFNHVTRSWVFAAKIESAHRS